MTLGPSFRQDDLEKALRKVRTMAGVKFFGMPIGTIISPGMVRDARAQHGDKKTDAMLVSQQRNVRRDARQSHFQNQAQVRAKKRAERVEANAAHRDRVRRDKEIREFEAGRAKAKAGQGREKAYDFSTLTQPEAAPKATGKPVAKPDAKTVTTPKREDPEHSATPATGDTTNAKIGRMVDLLHTDGKWSAKDIDDAIRLVMEHRMARDAQVREIVQDLVRRLQKEEK